MVASSNLKGVPYGNCGWPSALRIHCIDIASLILWKATAVLASAIKVTTWQSHLHTVKIGPWLVDVLRWWG